MKNPIIQYEPKKLKKPGMFSHLPLSHKILGIMALTIPVLAFSFIGIVDALGSMVLSNAENAYMSNLARVKTTLTACEASYQSLVALKNQAGLKVNTTESGCHSF